jgi:hypothetical protein
MPRLDSTYKVSNSNVVPIDLISWNVAGKMVSINVYQAQGGGFTRNGSQFPSPDPNQAHTYLYTAVGVVL